MWIKLRSMEKMKFMWHVKVCEKGGNTAFWRHLIFLNTKFFLIKYAGQIFESHYTYRTERFFIAYGLLKITR